jgi:hypothetical protein
MNEQQFINHVREHALRNYETGGWDYVVEAWEDGDILEYWSDANGDSTKAFKAIAEAVKTRYDYAQEIRNA